VWAATALFGATLLLWTVTIPMFRGPDETDHVSAALYWSENHEWPGYKAMFLLDSVEEARLVSGFHWNTEPPVILPSLTSDEADAVRVHLPFDELGQGDSSKVNKAAQHPPLYSMLVGSVHPATDGLPWDTEVWVFRMFSVLLMWPLPLIAAAIARRLGGSKPLIIASALSICAVPQLAFVGGTVNNDNLLNAAGAWLALGLVVILTGDLRKRTAVWIGLAAAVALLVKAWAIPIVVVIVAVYIVMGVRQRVRQNAAASLAVFCAVALLGAWWWIRNAFIYCSLQPSGHIYSLAEPLSFGEGVVRTASRFSWEFSGRFWAILSIKDGERAYPVWMTTLLLLGLVALLVLAVRRSRRLGIGRATVVLMLMSTALTMVIMVAEAGRFAMRTGIASGIQGRYLYGSITLIGVVAVLGLSTLVRPRWLPTAVGGFAVAFTLASFLRAVSYHYGESRWSNPIEAFPDLLAWSPLPAPVVIAFVVAFVGCAGWVVWEVVPIGRRIQGSHAAA
jgi:hypothetical protein